MIYIGIHYCEYNKRNSTAFEHNVIQAVAIGDIQISYRHKVALKKNTNISFYMVFTLEKSKPQANLYRLEGSLPGTKNGYHIFT